MADLHQDALQDFIEVQGSGYNCCALSDGGHDSSLTLALIIQPCIQDDNSSPVSNRFHQDQVIFIEESWLRMYKCDHANQIIARQDRDAHSRFCACPALLIIRAAQPAWVLTGVSDQDSLARTRHQARQAMFECQPQLQRCMIMMRLSTDQKGRLDWLGVLI